jgi:3-hydroxyisobutyrate dehydrogenase
MQKIALIGLGAMGGGMARRMLSQQVPLTVFTRRSEVREQFAQQGAQVASSPREAASRAEVVISIVADNRASRSIWLGEKGVLSGVKPGTILIESSTLSPAWIGELSAAASSLQCPFLDAPVTGSKPHAESGELLFLVGGEKNVVERVRPVLSVMSRGIVHLGGVGSGTLMKLVNNFLNGVQAAAFAEALVLVERLGLEPRQTLDIITNGAAGSPIVKTMATRMTEREYHPNFNLRLMEKDLSYVLDVARQTRFSLRSAEAALELFRQAIDNGWGDKDFSSVIEPLRDPTVSTPVK